MKKNQTMSDHIWQFFCSVKLAVYTLVALTVTSIIGTVILQNGSDQEYLRLYGQTWTNLIKVFNINDMYHAWWFLGLIVLLCINIVVCSIERLTVTWKIIFPKAVRFKLARFTKQKQTASFLLEKSSDTVLPKYETFLSKHVGKVVREETQAGVALFAEKGRWTRIGVYIIHFSILLLLVGALIGTLFGFKANLRLDEGATSDTAFLAKKRTAIKLGFEIRCNDFEVQFYDTGAPKEFKSNLTIIENGKETFTKDIRVNHPLRYKGINIFQSFYGTAQPDAVLLEIVRRSDKETTQHEIRVGQQLSLPGEQGTFKLEGFLPNYDFQGNNLGEAFILTVTPKKGSVFQIGLPTRFPTFDKMRKGDLAFVIKKFEQKHYTGLQITKDPGVLYVYAGFIFLILGCWVTFFMSHQSVCIQIESDTQATSKVFVFGITNRNKQSQKLKIKKMATKLKDL
ncbi:MAG: cytochrome c biogenesis protein ResB [Desulfobacula sp.]|nr:cytochrome c biogenesis protein ResB [Desulfobacula sp.]